MISTSSKRHTISCLSSLAPSTYSLSLSEDINVETSCHAHSCGGVDGYSPKNVGTKDLHHCDGISRTMESDMNAQDTDDDYATFLGMKIKTSSLRNFNFRLEHSTPIK